jgi:pilus assembly protein CpaC
MSEQARRRLSPWLVLSLLVSSAPARTASAQAPDPQGIVYNVQSAHQRLEMVVNSSRILTLDQNIPVANVANPEVVTLTPLSPTQVQVFAKKAGVTTINLWNERKEIRNIDVVVYGDARELRMVLEAQFPRSSLTVTPLANSVIIGGFVDRPDIVNRIIRISEDYHPNIINNITVGGVQQVLLDVKVIEVSRTKLRELGVDWAHFNGDDFLVSSVSGLISSFTSATQTTTFNNQTFALGIAHPDSRFLAVVRALRQDGVAKIVADPKIMTVSGRPARFLQGGEFPVLVPQSLGTVSVEYRAYGTEVDFVPIVLGNGLIRLELRPRVSEPDPALSVTINGTTVPALTSREVDTGVEMRAGQTLAIAGLVQTRTVSEKQGWPWLGEIPYIGTFFRSNSCRQNEVETLIMVTPHLVDAMECHEVPPCGPGTHTTVPDDHELYWKGYLEVPKCCPPGGYDHGLLLGPDAPAGGVHYQHGDVHSGAAPSMPPPGAMPQANEEVSPPVPPQPPQLVPPMTRQAPARGPQLPAPQAKSTPAPVRTPPVRMDPPEPQYAAPAANPRTPAPAAVRRAPPPLPTQDARVAQPEPNNRQERYAPPEPRPRTPAIPASARPSFIGPTGYDVD